jgi:hypothetical protein
MTEWYDDPTFYFPDRALPPRPRRVRQGVYGNGRLANRQDIEPLLAPPQPGEHALCLPDITLLVEAGPDGSALQPLLHRALTLAAHLLQRHILLDGTTGAGKTQKLILPLLRAALADPRHTIFAIDAKGGVLFDFVCYLARRHRPGQRVEQVNLKDAARTTVHWNPATRLRTRADALQMAHAVVTNAETGVQGSGGGVNELFWVNSSINLLADILLALVHDPKETASLARAKEIVDRDAYELATFADRHPHHEEFDRRYPAIARVLEGREHVTQQCVVADLAMRLQLLGDEHIAAATSAPGGLDLTALLRQGGVLILEVPEAHSKQLVPLTNLFVSQLFSALMDEAMRSPGGRLPRPCSVFLDEFGSAVGRLADFDCRLSTLRSRAVSVVAAVQTLSQIAHLYGNGAGAVLGGFCTKVFFGGGLDQADARYASELSGVCTVESVTVTETNEVGAEDACRLSLTRVPTARAVLLPEEVARPPVNPLLGAPVTVFLPDAPPCLAYLPPAYQVPELAAALGQPAAGEVGLRSGGKTDATLGEAELTGRARAWWDRLKKLLPADQLGDLLTRLDGLREAHAQLAEPKPSLLEMFAAACRDSGTQDLQASLSFLHWSLAQKVEAQTRDADGKARSP